MFERYTEKARRVIFFARYEASQYGSSVIAPEHLLLGLLREDRAAMHRLVGRTDLTTEIRTEIDKAIKRGNRISTSVEVPLSAESKAILLFAGEEADRIGHRHIGTEHILLGILCLQDSLAATLLIARGAKAETIRRQVAIPQPPVAIVTSARPAPGALYALEGFLGGLQGEGSHQPAAFFEERGEFIDSCGKRWVGRKEIEKGADTLLAPFAKKNAKFFLEGTTHDSPGTVVASVLWEFPAVSAGRSKSMLRMSIVLASSGLSWAIVLVQVTPLVLGLEAAS